MKSELLVAVLLCTLAVASRLVPHEFNLTPLLAVTLFGAFFFGRKPLAVAVPFVAMLMSDAVIGVYNWPEMVFTYAGLLFPLVFATTLRHRLNGWTVAGTSLVSSLFFFVVSNFGAWAFSPLYPRTTVGLWSCYVAAVPFWRWNVVGDVAWSFALFGAYALVRRGLEPHAAQLAK